MVISSVSSDVTGHFATHDVKRDWVNWHFDLLDQNSLKKQWPFVTTLGVGILCFFIWRYSRDRRKHGRSEEIVKGRVSMAQPGKSGSGQMTDQDKKILDKTEIERVAVERLASEKERLKAEIEGVKKELTFAKKEKERLSASEIALADERIAETEKRMTDEERGIGGSERGFGGSERGIDGLERGVDGSERGTGGSMKGFDIATGGGSEMMTGGGSEMATGGGSEMATGGGSDMATGGSEMATGGGSDMATGGGSEVALGGGSAEKGGRGASSVRKVGVGSEVDGGELPRGKLTDNDIVRRAVAFFKEMDERRISEVFTRRDIPIAAVDAILRTGTTGPVSTNSDEPWTFVSVHDKETKKEIRQAVEHEEHMRYLKRQEKFGEAEKTPDADDIYFEWEKPYIDEAPWLVLVFRKLMPIEPTETDSQQEEQLQLAFDNEISIAVSVGLLLASVKNCGLNSMTSTPLHAGPAICDLMDRPSDERLLLILPIGFINQPSQKKTPTKMF